MTFTRRTTLALGAAATLAGLSGTLPAFAADGDMHDVAKLMAPDGLADKPLGSPDAKVTLIEYASPTCPHCAIFHNETYPAFKQTYVDSGRVLFILRPFVRNVLDAVVFMLAEAAGAERYNDVVATYFHTQNDWAASNTPRDAMLAIAKQLGFTDESFEAALTNQDLFTGMEKLREQAMEQFGLTGTPTFYLNGKQLTGEQTLEQLAAEINPLLPPDQVPTLPATSTPQTPAPAGESSSPVSPSTPAPATPAPATPAPATPAPAQQ